MMMWHFTSSHVGLTYSGQLYKHFLIIITIIISTTTPSTDTIYNDVMCDLIEIRKEWIRFACKEKTLYRNRRQFIM